MLGCLAIRIAAGELRRELGEVRKIGERPQVLERLRKGMREQAERHRLAGPDFELELPIEAHLAVAAEADGAHVDGLNHGAPASDERAFRADHRPPARHHGDVRGGAPHVRDDEIALSGEKSRADHARRRPGQHGLDRVLERDIGAHQRAVALHDHERCVDRFLGEHLRECLDQVPDPGRQACVQHRRERAARRIELRAQLVRARHGPLRKPADELAGARFVLGIAHREARRDRVGLDPRVELLHRGLYRALIQRRPLLTRRAVPAFHAHESAAVALDAGALDHRVVETDQQRADGTETVLDHGVGCKRGRYRHQAHVRSGARQRANCGAPRGGHGRCRSRGPTES